MRPHHSRSAATTTTTTTTTTLCYQFTFEAVVNIASPTTACQIVSNGQFNTQKITLYYNQNSGLYYTDASCQNFPATNYGVMYFDGDYYSAYFASGQLYDFYLCACGDYGAIDYGSDCNEVCTGTGYVANYYLNAYQDKYYSDSSCSTLINGYIGVPSVICIEITNGVLGATFNC